MVKGFYKFALKKERREERENCNVHEKRITHNIDLYASLLFSHSRKRRRIFDVKEKRELLQFFHLHLLPHPPCRRRISHSSVYQVLQNEPEETKNCIFHVAHFSAAYSFRK